ncbi:MAG: rRNA pseudouridine synthase [Bacteroidales bacterium]|nr:rRNA pseudouridine synthase [Bacteroidales bacterium]
MADKKKYTKKKPINKFSGKNPKKSYLNKETNIIKDEEIRLNKYLANAGICSRRDADKLITDGFVKVNGKFVTELGTKVKKTDIIKYKNKLIKSEKHVYILLNKPKGVLTTVSDDRGRKTVLDFFRNKVTERIYPVGRLDKDSTGILLLTNDGDLTKKLTHPKYNKKKIYHIFLNKELEQKDAEKLVKGIELEDGFMKFDTLAYPDPKSKKDIGIEIHSGRNRIIRRMFAELNYDVLKLDRVYFAGLTKKDLKRGKWRFLSEREISNLKKGSYE